jgi:hypothetical protein
MALEPGVVGDQRRDVGEHPHATEALVQRIAHRSGVASLLLVGIDRAGRVVDVRDREGLQRAGRAGYGVVHPGANRVGAIGADVHRALTGRNAGS